MNGRSVGVPRWQRRALSAALLVVLAGCLMLAVHGQEGGAMLIAGYALLWFSLIRMLVLAPQRPKGPTRIA